MVIAPPPAPLLLCALLAPAAADPAPAQGPLLDAVAILIDHPDPGGQEELVLGDPTWDRRGMGEEDDVGRVVLYAL